MDERQFDRLARRVATAAPRRTILRAVAGAVAGALVARHNGGRALAQEGGLPPGAACAATAECSQAGGPVVCADNGYATDGALNCCRNAGGACADVTYSADCCSGLYCRNGACTDLSVTGELPPGSYCTATDQCSQDGGPVVCADNGYAADGALNCCRAAGGACRDATSSADCCAGLLCVEGVCAGAASTGGDVAPGGVCTATSQCSQTAGQAICADNGLVDDGGLNCCLLEAIGCGSDAECCAGLVCGDNQATADGTSACCTWEGNRCSSDAGCCGGLLCTEGVCRP